MTKRTVSHYQILEPLGEGGMGVVYKAEDTKLKRTVALKFLSKELTGTGEHAERFLREARAAAGLDHPNICTLYEIDRAGGETFLSMAFLDGETLDRRIAAGPLPLPAVYEIGRQAAEGLAAAHAAGVVHRDVKPSNIMVSDGPHGRPAVKLMDFGLAKISGESQLTKVDVRLGTAAYMSPEQSMGDEVGPASDLWSLGGVLYEMVAGEPPFKGHYDQAILYSVLNEDPEPLTSKRSQVPLELEWIVDKCLAKSPADRYQSAAELAVDLDALARKATQGRTTIVSSDGAAKTLGATGEVERARSAADEGRPLLSAARRPRAAVAAVAAAALLAAGFAGGRFLAGGEEPPPAPTRRFTLRPDSLAAQGVRLGHVAVSPNGEVIAYSGAGMLGGLWLQSFDRHEPVRVEGVGGVRALFWSPDGEQVGFVGAAGIGKVALRRLDVTMLVDDPDLGGTSAAWSADGQAILFTAFGGRIQQVSAMGGPARQLDDPHAGPEQRRSLTTSLAVIGLSADRQVLLYGQRSFDRDSVVARPLSDGTLGEPVILAEGMFPVYSASGHILYHPKDNSAAIWAVPFSPENLELTGEAFLVEQNGSNASVSSDGVLVYSDDPRTGEMRLAWFDAQGRQVGTIGREQPWMSSPVVSPDGGKVVVVAGRGRDFDLWVHDADRPVVSRLTFDDLQENGAVWSPDGASVVFAQLDSPELRLVSASGGEAARTIYRAEGQSLAPLAWSPDGCCILLQHRQERTRPRLPSPSAAGQQSGGAQLPGSSSPNARGSGLVYLERGAGDAWQLREFHPVVPYIVDEARFSPDGRYVAFESNETEDFQIYVRPFPDGGQRWQVTTDGGRQPRWSAAGGELYYLRGATLHVVEVSTASGFSVGDSRPLFSSDSLSGSRRRSNWDVAPGARFALVGPAGGARPPAIRVVLNWFSEFRSL